MHLLTVFVAQYFLILPVLIAGLTLWKLKPRSRRLEFVVLLVIGGLLSLTLAKVGSHLINDPRPFIVGHFTPWFGHSIDNGFPSDHALLGSFLGWATLRYNKRLGLLILALAALIGLARVLAGVHHLEDIIGSFIISGIAVWLVGWGLAKYRALSSNRV